MKKNCFFRVFIERIVMMTLCLSLFVIVIPEAHADTSIDYFRIGLLGEGAYTDGSDLYVPVGSEIRFFFKAPGTSYSMPRDHIAVFVGKADDLPDMLSEYVGKRGDYYRYTNHEEIDGDFLEKYLTHKGGQGFLSETPGVSCWTTYLAEKAGTFTFGVLFERYDTKHEIAESYIKEYMLFLTKHRNEWNWSMYRHRNANVTNPTFFHVGTMMLHLKLSTLLA